MEIKTSEITNEHIAIINKTFHLNRNELYYKNAVVHSYMLNNKLLGFAVVRNFGSYSYIESVISLNPNNGIATGLVNHIVKQCEQVNVYTTNATMENIFKKLRFKKTGNIYTSN